MQPIPACPPALSRPPRGARRSASLAAGLLLSATLALSAPAAFGADLVVSAAASLTNAFKALAESYERAHPQTKVILNFGASDVLMQQIINGAPADVFASADQDAMNKAEAARVVNAATRHDFAANQLALIVPADSKQEVGKLQDLTRPEFKRIAFGNPASVPVGRYTKGALEAAGVWDAVSAKGVMAQNVRQSLDYVARGEVEAGFVFATDAAIMPDKVKVALRVPTRQPVTYPIAVTAVAKQPAEAAAFVGYVLSGEGQAVLAKYGFLKP
ncbi:MULTISPECIES: molybdate ABC transporter substrate-binding protein [Cupriavidus]